MRAHKDEVEKFAPTPEDVPEGEGADEFQERFMNDTSTLEANSKVAKAMEPSVSSPDQYGGGYAPYAALSAATTGRSMVHSSSSTNSALIPCVPLFWQVGLAACRVSCKPLLIFLTDLY
ncbi:hypothetical protein [Burkholderia ubonensis]|uniref:hypothetical protein n=1 Tax=Burkholderia ubonensis TaxID=101571 RepID=UPI000AF761A8